jgi:hypothetical protein
MRKIVLSVMVVAFSLALASTSFAKKKGYAEGSAGAGSITGTVMLKGAAMAPIMEDLSKGKNVEFCSSHPDAKDGIRPRVKVSAAGGKLKDAVVFIENIDGGKPWGDAGKAAYDFTKCDIVQKMLVIRKPSKAEKKSGGILTVKNNDADILHNPHGYSVVGASRKTLFNKPLPNVGDVAEVTKNIGRLKPKKDKHFFLQCDQHNYMESDARIVWNPYYAVTGADGAFTIDGVPAGKYKVTAWQPYVGESTQEVTVAAGAAKADFTLAAK